jgi:hypothetical protein
MKNLEATGNYLHLCNANNNMLYTQKHIESVNRFSPMADLPVAGHVMLQNKL